MAYTKAEFSAPYELQAWVQCSVNENGGITFNRQGPPMNGYAGLSRPELAAPGDTSCKTNDETN